MNKVVVIYSGGMDSFTLLNQLMMTHETEIHALSFDYGQRHNKELQYAIQFCADNKIPHNVVNIQNVGSQLMRGSSQTDQSVPVPTGHYADDNMKTTVVPNRNMIMISMAVAHAVSIGADKVYIGAHSGDHAIYPDCRPGFLRMMDKVCKIANYDPVEVHAPFIYMDKADIAKVGRDMNLDYDKTWTCYVGGEEPCGECGACVERKEALEAAGLLEITYPEDDFPSGDDVEGSE